MCLTKAPHITSSSKWARAHNSSAPQTAPAPTLARPWCCHGCLLPHPHRHPSPHPGPPNASATALEDPFFRFTCIARLRTSGSIAGHGLHRHTRRLVHSALRLASRVAAASGLAGLSGLVCVTAGPGRERASRGLPAPDQHAHDPTLATSRVNPVPARASESTWGPPRRRGPPGCSGRRPPRPAGAHLRHSGPQLKLASFL